MPMYVVVLCRVIVMLAIAFSMIRAAVARYKGNYREAYYQLAFAAMAIYVITLD